MLNKVAGLFWEQDKPVQKGPTAKQVVPMPTTAVGPQVSVTPSAAVDQQMLNDINTVIAARTTPFSSLEQKIKTLQSTGLDETTATRAAGGLLKAEGKSAEAIVSSIDLHVRDVEIWRQQFASAAQSAMKVQVEKLRGEAASLSATNEQALQKIAQLEKEVQDMHAQIAERSAQLTMKNAEAATAEAEINAKINTCNATVDQVVNGLNMKKSVLSTTLI